MDENMEVAQEMTDPWDSIDLSDITDDGAGANQPETEESNETESGDTPAPETQEQTTESGVQEEPQPETFELKHLDSVQNVDREQVIALAQKGLDYDRKFAKYEELKQFRDTNRDAIDILAEMAGTANVPVAQMLTELRVRQLMDTGLSEAAAKQQMSLDSRERAIKRKEAERERAEQAETERKTAEAEKQKKQEERQRADIQRFLQTFPNAKPDSIPKEVWDTVKTKGVGLTEAYALFENQRLTRELETERQNAKNKALSTGSRGTAGQNSQMDEFTAAWYNDD